VILAWEIYKDRKTEIFKENHPT